MSDSQSRNVHGASVLVIDKDERVRAGMEALFGDDSVHVTSVADPAAAWELIERTFYSVILVDLDTPEPGHGVETTKSIAVLSPMSSVLMMSPRRAFDDIMACVRAGAIDVVLKEPNAVAYLKERIREAASSSLRRQQTRSTLSDVREFHKEIVDRLIQAERKIFDLEKKDPVVNETATVLLVSGDNEFNRALGEACPGMKLVPCLSGGEALDRSAQLDFQIALVSSRLDDLPASTVIRTLIDGHPAALVLAMGELEQPVELVQGETRIPVMAKLESIAALAGRLRELERAAWYKSRDRKFLQDFRERNYEFVRKLANVTARLEAL